MFQLNPLDELFPITAKNNVGIISRVPLASRILTWRYMKNMVWGSHDHHSYNSDNATFDKAKPFPECLWARIESNKRTVKSVYTYRFSPISVRWAIHPKISVIIPGASQTAQVQDNVKETGIVQLTDEQMQALQIIYDQYLFPIIHSQW